MASISTKDLFDTAVRLQLLERTIEISFAAGDSVSIKFPNTRRLADFLGIPHYAVLRYFAMLEKETLVTRAERIGIVTTRTGSRMMAGLMKEKYRNESEGILGSEIFAELLRKTGLG